MEKAPSFETVKSRKTGLPERTAEQIVQLIQNKELKANDKLPNEFELAAELNIGRGSVREAVKILTAKNILEVRRGKGTFIANDPGVVDDPLGLDFIEDTLQLSHDMLEVRFQLEPWVASLAAERATDEDCALLMEKCKAVEEAIMNQEDHLAADKEFHTALASCTHNVLMPKLTPLICRSVEVLGKLTSRSLKTETIIQHRAITDAVFAHDPARAEQAIIQHLKDNRDYLSRLSNERKSSSGE